jgi:hypothetical protein
MAAELVRTAPAILKRLQKKPWPGATGFYQLLAGGRGQFFRPRQPLISLVPVAGRENWVDWISLRDKEIKRYVQIVNQLMEEFNYLNRTN